MWLNVINIVNNKVRLCSLKGLWNCSAHAPVHSLTSVDIPSCPTVFFEITSGTSACGSVLLCLTFCIVFPCTWASAYAVVQFFLNWYRIYWTGTIIIIIITIVIIVLVYFYQLSKKRIFRFLECSKKKTGARFFWGV